MSAKQKIALIFPLPLLGVMTPVFRLLAAAIAPNWRLGWYLGLASYWLVWGAVFPWLMIIERRAQGPTPQRSNGCRPKQRP